MKVAVKWAFFPLGRMAWEGRVVPDQSREVPITEIRVVPKPFLPADGRRLPCQ